MRAIRRAASAALLGTAVLAPGLWTSAAGAHGRGGFQVQVTPRVIAVGGRVMLAVRGCPGDTTVSSEIFDTVRLGAHAGARTVTVGRAAPSGDSRAPAAVGDHEVTFRCADGALRTVGLTVTGGPGGPPRRGVRAGTGGSRQGFDLQELAVGTLLLAGALGMAYRRSVRHGAGESGSGEPPAPAHRAGV